MVTMIRHAFCWARVRTHAQDAGMQLLAENWKSGGGKGDPIIDL